MVKESQVCKLREACWALYCELYGLTGLTSGGLKVAACLPIVFVQQILELMEVQALLD